MNTSGNRRLIAAVALASTVIESGITFVEGVVQRLRDGAQDPDFDPDSLADELESDANRLAAALAANTPAVESDTAEEVDPGLVAEVDEIVATDGQDAASTEGRMTGGTDVLNDPNGGDSGGESVQTGSDLGGAAAQSSGGNVGSESGANSADTQNSDGDTVQTDSSSA